MKTKDVIHYLEGTVCLAEIDSSYIDEAVRMIKSGGNYVDMWESLKSAYGYRTTYDASGQQQLGKFVDVMNKIERVYFPERTPRRRKRINNMLECLSGIGTAVDINKLKHLLIELRDEEKI